MSIYDEIGGKDGVAAAVTEFYERVTGDASLEPYFASVDLSQLRAHMRAFLAAALGGPEVYAGRDMRLAHAGLGVTDDAYDRVVWHLVSTLTGLGVTGGTLDAICGKVELLRPEIVGA